MLKAILVGSSLLIASAAFAQSNMKSTGGASTVAPGQQPKTGTVQSNMPGQSGYAPGQQTNNPSMPGHSESAPGQMKPPAKK